MPSFSAYDDLRYATAVTTTTMKMTNVTGHKVGLTVRLPVVVGDECNSSKKAIVLDMFQVLCVFLQLAKLQVINVVASQAMKFVSNVK